MLNFIRNLDQKKVSLQGNFTWLAASQGANLIIPLLIYPYLIRIIGIENFGMVMFAQALAILLSTVVDFGFSISALREVALQKENKEALSIIVGELLGVRGLVFATCSIVILFPLYITPLSGQMDNLFLFSLTIVVGQMIIPSWFFQGVEKMKGIAFMTAGAKIIFILLVLLLVREKSDFVFINLYLGLSQIAIGVIALYFVFIQYKIPAVQISFKRLKERIRINKELFLSQLSIYAAGNMNVILLGFIANPLHVGYYAVVEKVLLAGRAPAVLIYQTIFPNVCRLSAAPPKALELFFSKLMKLIFILFIPLGILIGFFADKLVLLFTGQLNEGISYLLQIGSCIPFLAAISIPASQTFLAYNFKRTYLYVTVISALLPLLFGFVIIHSYGALGAVINAVFTELLATVLLYCMLSFKHRQYSVLKLFKPTW